MSRKGEKRSTLSPIDDTVIFNAMVQKGNRIQVPRLIRWHYRMESDQVLKVKISYDDEYVEEEFLARMSKDGRITIPNLTLKLVKRDLDNPDNMLDYTFKITLEPP